MSETNSKKNIVVVVCGGIAAYKSCYVVRQLQRQNFNVRVAMSKTATQFVTPLTFATLVKHQVYTDALWQQSDAVAHVKLANWADAVLVVPATANIIAKMATGLADNFVSTFLLAASTPKLVVPAMNDNMWNNFATQQNVKTLCQNAVAILHPAAGMLAEGYVGVGRLPEPDEICRWVKFQLFAPKDLAGKKVVVTAGPTVEALDPVRFLSNFSSGKMGYAIAQAAALRGADVMLISGPTRLTTPFGVNQINITSAQELLVKTQQAFVNCDVCVMTAAVADYHAKHQADHKIKREHQQTLTLELAANPDIAKTLGQMKTTQCLVGFAAETNDVLNNGQRKLQKKGLDLLVANDVSQTGVGFNSDDNQVTFITKAGVGATTSKLPKPMIAQLLWDEVIKLW